jgi:hypothetical protein
MKRAILIGFSLAVASSSAYAWTEISVKQQNLGAKQMVNHSIKCNSGSTGTIVYSPNMSLGDYYLEHTLIYYKVKNLDQAARKFCGE